MKASLLKFLLFVPVLIACTTKPVVKMVTTTQQSMFETQPELNFSKPSDKDQVHVMLDMPLQKIEGFGGCFNELGWQALSILEEKDRESIMENLFGTEKGTKFNVCRMPLGANDFSIDWYSYNETPNDFEMKNFSIENDKKTLIPFIKAAYKYNQDLTLWASPWSPPSWMKHNNHYASVSNDPGPFYNGLSPLKHGLEGTDMFKVEPRYMEAYALYFEKFIQSYKSEGITINAVAPQNEYNSAQMFPSCTWTARGLNTFVGEYLGPKMRENGVEIWFGTLERANHLLADTLLKDKLSSKYITAVGFQWGGKGAIAQIHKDYPNMRLIQTESECGDGLNDWKHCLYTWSLMKHYFENGASIYQYWNIALKSNGMSRWGWRQNSLISVNEATKTYKYNFEYYLMKHFSHFIQKDSRMLLTKGEPEQILAFKNPDNSLVLLIANLETKEKSVSINLGKYSIHPVLKASSINTIHIK